MRSLFDAHPDGIFLKNSVGKTPLDCARSFNPCVVSFLDVLDVLDVGSG